MITGAQQWAFVWASYGVALAVVAGLVGWVLFEARRHARDLADLERRGVRRRSEQG
jgi:heme exporter protein D